MDPRLLADLRQLASHAADCARRTLDACDELHRRLSAAEDEAMEYQANVRRLRTERDAS